MHHMTSLTDQQRAAIERLETQLEAVTPEERARRMGAALSVSGREVEASLAEKGKKGLRKPPSPSAPPGPS